MNIHEDQTPPNSPEPGRGNNTNDQQVPSDHPGLQKIAKNENPRANENITDDADTTADAQDQVGTEITDGEDG